MKYVVIGMMMACDDDLNFEKKIQKKIKPVCAVNDA